MPAPDPRRRPALPRHGAAGLQALRRGHDRGARVPPDRDLRGGGDSSPAPRGSCPRRSRPTPSAPPSTRRCGAKKEGKRRDHPLQPQRPRPLRPERPTTPTWPASSRTTSTRPRRWQEALTHLPQVKGVGAHDARPPQVSPGCGRAGLPRSWARRRCFGLKARARSGSRTSSSGGPPPRSSTRKIC